MGIKFSNLASTTLSSGISNTATTITVADGSLFPTLGSGDFFFATLDSPPDSVEIVKVTARSGNTLTVVRAQDGTAASTHPAGEIIALRVTAGALNTIVDEITVQINAVIDSAPGALNTLNELASALGDDANFSTTVTNSLAAKLPLAGGTMSGALNMGSQNITNAGTIGSGAITSIGGAAGRYVAFDAINTINAAGTEVAIGLGVVSSGNTACDVHLVADRVGANAGSDFYIEQSDASGNAQETFRITELGNSTFAGTITSGAITSTGRGTFDELTLTGSTDNLTFNEASGDWTINNAQQNNGITIFDGFAGVTVNYNGAAVAQFDSSGGMNLITGSLRVGGTAVIDSSRNLTNIGTISSGSITSSGLHVLTATAGSVTPVSGADDLVVENNTTTGISILSPDNVFGQIVFGSPSDNDSGRVQYNHASDQMILKTSSTTALTIDSSQNASFAGNITLADNGKAIFGTSGDLEISHNGSASLISDVGNGDLFIRASSALRLQSAANENYLVAVADGAVNLYHNNLQKLATTSTGIDVTGTISSGAITSSGNMSLSNASVGNNITIARTDVSTSAIWHVGSSQAYIGSTSNTPFNIYQNGGQAIGIDTSKNATFAGTIGSGAITSTSKVKGASLETDRFIYHAGDTDTYIDFGTDSISFHAGAGDGSERMVINANNIQAGKGIYFLSGITSGAMSYAPTEGNTITQRNFLNFNLTNDASYPILTNRTPAGKFVLASGVDAGGGEIERLEVEGGNGTKAVNLKNSTTLDISGTTVIDTSRNLTNIGTISSGAITSTGSSTFADLFVASATPQLVLSDTGNGGGGAAEAKILFRNTDGDAMGIGYTGNTSANSDMIISTNAGGTFGAYLGLDAAAIADAQADIILEPKSNVRIATGSLEMGTTAVIDQSRNLTNIGTITSGAIDATASGEEVIRLNTTGNTGAMHFRDSDTLRGIIGFSNGSTLISSANDHDMVLRSEARLLLVSNTNNLGLTLSGGDTTFAGVVNTSDGSVSAVSYGFTGDLNTGMYSPANHQLGFAANGTQRLLINSTGATVTGAVSATGSINSSAGTIQTGGTTRITSGGNLENIGTINSNNSITTTGTSIICGQGTGAVALTTNDGRGNANVTFNHTSGVPDINGAACRIETNVDSSASGIFTFEVSAAAVTNGVSVALTEVAQMSTGGFNVSTGTLQIGGTSVIAANRNLQNIGTVSCGVTTINTSTNEHMVLSGSSDPYIRFQEGTTDKAYVQWNSGGFVRIANQESGEIAFWPTANSASELILIRNDTTTTSGNDFGSINFTSTDGTSDFPTQTVAQMPARIVAEATETQGEGDEGSRLMFFTKPNDTDKTADSVEQLRINHNGNVVIYNNDLSLSGNNIDGVTNLTIENQIIHAGDTDTYIQFHAANQFRVVTGGTERFEVNQGTATVAGTLNVRAAIDLADNDVLRFGSGDDIEMRFSGSDFQIDVNNGEDIKIRDGNNSNANRFTFDVDNGAFTATGNITAFSDRRVKAQFAPITDALSKVEQLHGQTYIRTDINDANRRYAGLIAQDVEVVLPEAVSEVDDHLALDYSATIALLVEAIKDLKDEVDELKEKLEAA